MLIAPITAKAQAIRDEGQHLLEEQRERTLEETLTKPKSEIQLPSSSEAGNTSEGEVQALTETEPSFVIHRIVFDGDRVLGEPERQRLSRDFLGQKLGPKRIDLLLRRITAAYLDRGYVTTRAYVGPQNLASGELKITIIPGVLEKLTIDGHPGHILPLSTGEPLNLAETEQAVDQINRLRSQHAEAKILPGQTPGGSVFTVDTHADKPWRISVGVDDYGQSSTGEQRQRVSLEYDNLLGLWDAWSMTSVQSANTRTELYASSVPVGFGTLSYTYAQAYSTVDILGLANTTLSRYYTVSWNQVVFRNQQWRDALDFSVTKRDTDRALDVVQLTPQRQSSARIAANALYRTDRGALTLEAGYSQGLARLGGDVDVANLPASSPHNQYEKWDTNLALAWTLSKDFSLRSTLVGQYSRVGLPGAEQLFLGGSGTVRGFEEGVVSGDRGAYMQNELQWNNLLNREQIASGTRFDPFLLLDASLSKQLVDDQNQRLVGVGVGLRASWKMGSADLAWARPQTAPQNISRADHLHFSLTLAF